MHNFQFTNEQIIYLHTHFEEYLNKLEGELQKQNQYVRGQLELLESTYGDNEDFDHESHGLYKRLMVDEMPKLLEQKSAFLRELGSKFSEIYTLLEEADPEYVEGVKESIFGQPNEIKEIIEQLNSKENGN